MRFLAVISVHGRDQKGVVAQFATYVAERGINIEDMQQRVVQGLFVMDMLVNLAEMTPSLDELSAGILELAKKIGMEAKITIHGRQRAKRVVLLVSKEPHCLDTLLAAYGRSEINGQIVAVLGNHDVLAGRAEACGLPFESQAITPENDKAAHFAWLTQRLEQYQPDLIVLARYMQIMPPHLVQKYAAKMINIHPSLLPFFPGANPYRQAWESGVRVTGCTAHFVTEQLDQGPIVLQDVFHINVGKDTAEEVRERGMTLEAQTLLRAVQIYLNEELLVVDGKVVFKPGVRQFEVKG